MAAPQLALDASLLQPFPEPPWVAMGAQGTDPARLGITDPERAAQMSAEDVIQYILECRNLSARARKTLEPTWAYHEDLFFLRSRDLEKEDWQSDIVVPEVMNTVKTARSLFQSALLDSDRYFTLIGEGDDYQNGVVRAQERWLKVVQENANFVDVLLDMWEQGLLLGSGCCKVSMETEVAQRPRIVQVPIYPDPEQMYQAQMMGMPVTMPQIICEPEQRWRVKATQVPIWHVYPDPLAANFYESWVVEESEVDESVLDERLATGVYDSLDDIGEGVKVDRGEWTSRQQRLGLYDAKTSSRRRHLVTEFTGDICDRDGKRVAKNWVVTIVNERAIVRMGPNPMWSGKHRYIWSTPIPYPGRPWGRPIVEAAASLQEEEQGLFNLILDDTKYAVMSAFLVDDLKATEPGDYETIEPGKIYRGEGEFIRKLQFGTQANMAWPAMDFMQKQIAKSSHISEWADGSPTSRGRPSAMEVQTKTQAGTAFIHNIARRLEDNDVARGLQLMLEYLLQFGDDSGDPRLSNVLQELGGDMMADPNFRLQQLDVPMRLKVRGISMVITREQLAARKMQIVQMGQQLGIPGVDLVKPFYSIITDMGETPEQMGFPTEPTELNAMLMQMQAIAAMGGVPGGGPMGPPQQMGGGEMPPSPDAVQRTIQGEGAPAP